MSCAACTWLIETLVGDIEGVRDVNVHLALSRVTLTLEPGANPSRAVSTIEKLGYRVRPWRTDARIEQLRHDSKQDLRRLGVAGIGMMQVGMFAIALHAGALQGMTTDIEGLLRWVSTPLSLFVLFYSGRTFFSKAWQHLKKRTIVMDTSVALALTLATIASLWATLTGTGETYYDSITMFIFFLLSARYVEQRLRNVDVITLLQVEDHLPEFVAKKTDDQWIRVMRTSLQPGDIILIPLGDAVPVDATLAAGSTSVNESVFTGESIPRTVTEGDPVYAGTLNLDATVEARVDLPFRQSRLAGLQSQVTSARSSKPHHIQLIDRFASTFVLIVIGAAALTALTWWFIDADQALWVALSVLVVACPCALSLATPAAIASATSALRRRGILVKSEFGLANIVNIDRVLVDKTGTLTQTSLSLDALVLAEGVSERYALDLAASLQKHSNHPAAQPFHDHCTTTLVKNITVVPGAGMQGFLGNDEYRLGSNTFCDAIAEVPPHPELSRYWVALVQQGRWLAWFGLTETLREGALSMVRGFQARGLPITVVSGDAEHRVQALAEQLHVAYRAEQTPADKLALLHAHQDARERVLVIGDGVNDAPFLGAAHCAIAVGGASAMAQAEADFVITHHSMNQIDEILTSAARCQRVIRQNLIWAAGYNFTAIPFAALGYVPPWLAALGMSASSILVVLNSLRLRRHPSERNNG
jgi:Cu2+-exporting ATPase